MCRKCMKATVSQGVISGLPKLEGLKGLEFATNDP